MEKADINLIDESKWSSQDSVAVQIMLDDTPDMKGNVVSL